MVVNTVAYACRLDQVTASSINGDRKPRLDLPRKGEARPGMSPSGVLTHLAARPASLARTNEFRIMVPHTFPSVLHDPIIAQRFPSPLAIAAVDPAATAQTRTVLLEC